MVIRGYGEGSGTPLQYSCLEIPWTEEPGGLQSTGSQGAGHDWTTSLSLSCIGEGNGNPSRVLAWRSPGTGEPGGLLSLGSHRVGHDWSNLARVSPIESFRDSNLRRLCHLQYTPSNIARAFSSSWWKKKELDYLT